MQGKHLRRLSCPSLSGQDLQQAHVIAGKKKNGILTYGYINVNIILFCKSHTEKESSRIVGVTFVV